MMLAPRLGDVSIEEHGGGKACDGKAEEATHIKELANTFVGEARR
jgi:hypothetical protein